MTDFRDRALNIVHYDENGDIPAPAGGVIIQGPIVTGNSLSTGYNEIIVDPAGAVGGYTSIQAAVTYAAAQASASSPWTVRLLPGVYSIASSIVGTSAQFVNIVGAGRDKTIILKSSVSVNSVASGRGSDPVLTFDGSSACRIALLTLKHSGVWSDASHQPEGLNLNNALNFQATGVRIESTYLGLEAASAAFPTGGNDESNEIQIHDSIIVVGHTGSDTSSDTVYLQKTDVRLVNTSTLISSAVGGPDNITMLAGTRLNIIGGEHIRRLTAGTSAVLGGRALAISVTTNALATYCNAIGARFYTDSTRGDYNAPNIHVSTVDINATTAITGATADFSFVGCKIDRESGNIAGLSSFIGLQIGTFGTTGNLGVVRLEGCEIRDLGGTGATLRQDVVAVVTASGGNRQPKAIYNNGSRISSWTYRSTVGSPTINHGALMAIEPSPNYQGSSATFPTGATVSVTLPIAYPAVGTSVTDYNVALEPSVNETFWVTNKTNVGFILNSSNASSVANVRFVVTR